jgi:hypothetical protein
LDILVRTAQKAYGASALATLECSNRFTFKECAMAWHPDLSPYVSVPDDDTKALLAVGWLEPGYEISKGDVLKDVFFKLCQLAKNSWAPVASAGVHFCGFCRFTGGNFRAGFDGYELSGVGSSEIYIPGKNVIYVSPNSIPHYLDSHGYCPPAEFIAAVLSCPPMRSNEYFKAILMNGGRALLGKREHS